MIFNLFCRYDYSFPVIADEVKKYRRSSPIAHNKEVAASLRFLQLW